MIRLFKSAFCRSRYRGLIFFIILSMVMLTFATQLEILALGIITRKGPDVFELFAPREDGRLVKQDTILKSAVDERWNEIDAQHKGVITKQDALRFMKEQKHGDLIATILNRTQSVFPLEGNIRNLALFLLFIAFLKAITLFSNRYSTKLIAIKLSRDLRQEYFEHIQSLPMSFYHKYNIGSLSSRVVGDAAQISEAVNACLVNYIQTPFTVITTSTLCFLTSWKLSLLIFLGFPAIVIPIIFLADKVKKVSKQILQNQETFASVLIDFIAGIQTVKIFGMEHFSLAKYQEQNKRMAKLEKKSARYDLSTRPIVHTIAMLFLATALMTGLYGLQMSVSEIFFYCGLLYVFYEPIKKFAEENSHIQRGVAAAERMFEVMALQPQVQDNKNAKDLQDFKGPIEFRDVWFGYNQEWVLKGISFSIRKGETVAIVGPTGSGKSTIVQLLPRLYDIQKGQIIINDRPITHFTQKSLRENIAFVPQKPFLFVDTVSENISVGKAMTDDHIRLAAIKAHADEFICRLPCGYQTELEEMGKSLSGGQQQRLAIARALAKQAPILIMDEATSALDTISEQHIKSALYQLKGEVTQIIIAHRFSTIEDADRIIYIENGIKIAEGNKDELLIICPAFKRMWEMRHLNPTCDPKSRLNRPALAN